MPCLEPALRDTGAQHPRRPHRPSNAFDPDLAQIAVFEQPAGEPTGLRPDHHRARLGQRLQPGGEIGRLPDYRLLLRRTLADEISDHHQPRLDPDPGLQWRIGRDLQLADRLDEPQPGPHGSLGGVLVGARIAEIGEHAVAQVFRDEPARALDHRGTAAVVRADHAAQILRVEPRRKRGRADQVAEQYCHLSPLGFRPGNGLRGLRFGCGCRSQSRNRAQQAPAVADQADAELPQILRRQAWQQIGGYPVLVEGRRVLV